MHIAVEMPKDTHSYAPFAGTFPHRSAITHFGAHSHYEEHHVAACLSRFLDETMWIEDHMTDRFMLMVKFGTVPRIGTSSCIGCTRSSLLWLFLRGEVNVSVASLAKCVPRSENVPRNV